MRVAIAGVAGVIGLFGYIIYKETVSPTVVSSTEGNNVGNVGNIGSNIDQKIVELAQAIAFAEGFYVPGSVPSRANNPGDLGTGDCGAYPVIHATGSDVCQLPNVSLGWQFLYTKVRKMLTGQSHVYSVNMTITEVAQKYAGDWQNWAKNVSAKLGVSPATTLQEWISL